MNARYDEIPDERLIQFTLAGEDEAFAELVRRHKSRVFGTARRFAQNDHELDDVCQEIFIKVYRNLRQFRGDAPFGHWVSRIAVRACYDLLRKTWHKPEQVPLDGLPLAVEDNMAPQRAREVLEFAMAKLSPEQRLVITLLELEEKSVRETTELTGWSEANVKVRAFRARQALKKILEINNER